MRISLPSLGTAVLLMITQSWAGAPNTLTDQEKSEGWRLLFDGKSPAGWAAIGKSEFPQKGWSIRDGLLEHQKGGGGGDIVTTEKFENFELTWEWKIGEAGNSGVKYNLVDPARNLGFEYQLLDDAKHPDGIKGGTLHQTGALYDLLSPAPDKKMSPVGQWNQSRLVVDGDRVEHWLNGAQTVRFEIGSADLQQAIARSKYKASPQFGVKKASPILLQDHGDDVAFRNVKLRPIPSR
jgi:hypothetical protein